MKKYPLSGALILAFALLTFSSQAQVVKPDTTSNWKKRLIFNFNVNQASFSTNWKAGGINSIGLNSSLNYRANYAKDKLTWDNEFDFLYGFVNNQGQGFRKTLDRIFLDTKVGHKLNDKWDLFTSLSFLSQFYKGYRFNDDNTQDLISDFLAPAFVTSAWGLEYHPAKFFQVRISPFAPRLTVLRDNNGRFSAVDPLRPYGVEVGTDTRFEWLAFQLAATFDKDIASNINLKWRYMMFANYETLQMKTIDHRLDLNVTAKLTKYISVGLGAILVYDFDQDPGLQLSQAFNFGFRYTFQNFEDKK